LETPTRRLTLDALKGKLEHCQLTCEALERQFNHPNLTSHKRLELEWRRDEVLKDKNVAQRVIAALERAAQVGGGGPNALTAENF
jgi:hypothetical protein